MVRKVHFTKRRGRRGLGRSRARQHTCQALRRSYLRCVLRGRANGRHPPVGGGELQGSGGARLGDDQAETRPDAPADDHHKQRGGGEVPAAVRGRVGEDAGQSQHPRGGGRGLLEQVEQPAEAVRAVLGA
eukprot:scaffold17948_cov135-Isochrysis_galbana.AAC.2